MKNVLKAAAVAASLIPIGLGFAYTAGASVGSVGDEVGFHTIDVFEVDGYEVERENVDGTVTEIVTDPSGDVVAPADVPAEVAAQMQDWQPEPSPLVVERDGGVACYGFTAEVVADDEWIETSTSDDGFHLVSISPAGTEAVYGTTVINDSVLQAHLEAGDPLIDLPGALQMARCDD